MHYYFGHDDNSQHVEEEDSGGMTKYHWDGLNVILERDGGDTTTDTHTHGPVAIEGIGTHLTTSANKGARLSVAYPNRRRA